MPLTPVYTTQLNGSNGFQVLGAQAGDGTGYDVSAAGDVNGDGISDFLVGSNRQGSNSQGAVFVVFGKSSGWTSSFNLSTLDGSNGFKVQGLNYLDSAGRSATRVGDLNGDGYSDIMFGAPNADASNVESGAGYVVFGHSGAFASSLSVSALDGTNGFRLSGYVYDYAGYSSTSGDLNGDGFSDMILSAPGADVSSGWDAGNVYVYFGQTSGSYQSNINLNLTSLNGTNGFLLKGASPYEYTGWSVASAGDVNGDGFEDLVIGNNSTSTDRAGYVVFGKASGWASAIELSALNGTTGFQLFGKNYVGWVPQGISSGNLVGYSAASAGDINGDGYADIIIGNPGVDSYKGASYVVYGKASGWASTLNLTALNGTDGFKISGAVANDYAGYVGSAGDINSDGYDDLIVGAPFAQPTLLNQGSVYVIYGKASAFAPTVDLATITSSDGFRIDGGSGNDLLGVNTHSASDVNNDGHPDLVLGAPGAYTTYNASYVYFSPTSGVAPTGAYVYRGTTQSDTLGGSAYADSMTGGAGSDQLYGRDGNDTLNGGTGDDTIDGGAGVDLAQLSGSRSDYIFGVFDGTIITQGPDGLDYYTNIEQFKFGSSAPITVPTLSGLLGAITDRELLVFEKLGNMKGQFAFPTSYTGPVPGLRHSVLGSPGDDILIGTRVADFINSLTGMDAVDGGAGNDVIDGGLGSNFLTGGAGVDTFFIDGRGAASGNVTWSTVTDWGSGDALTVWGYQPGVTTFIWVANGGAVGYTGVTLHADLDGNGVIDSSMTWSGKTQSTLPTMTFGTVDGQDYIFFGG